MPRYSQVLSLPNSGRRARSTFTYRLTNRSRSAVPIVIGETAAGRPAAAADAGGLGHVRERAVVVVAVQVVAAERGDVEILPAVAVHVRGADAHAPARAADAGAVGDVFELPAAEVAVERAARRLGSVGAVDRQGIDEVDVQPAVVVVVEERDAAAHRLHDVLLFRRGMMLERDAGLARDVAVENRRRAGLAAGRRGSRQEEQCGKTSHRFPPPFASRGSAPARMASTRAFISASLRRYDSRLRSAFAVSPSLAYTRLNW